MRLPSHSDSLSTQPIDDFSGSFFWLSNFFPSPIDFEGDLYVTVENAFQAAKSTDRTLRQPLCDCGPDEAKLLGHHLPLRDDWETIKLALMDHILAAKFSIPALRRRLIATAPRPLVNRNIYGDTFWGVCRGQGGNALGEALMRLRHALIQEQP